MAKLAEKGEEMGRTLTPAARTTTIDGQEEQISSEDVVRYWYRGHDVPRTREQHVAVLGVLDFPDPTRKNMSMAMFQPDKSIKAQHNNAKMLEDMWGKAETGSRDKGVVQPVLPKRPKPKTRKNGAGNGAPKVRLKGNGSSNILEPYNDRDTGPRYHDPYKKGDYWELSESGHTRTLKDIQSHTENFHEYLRVSRLLKGGLSFDRLEQETGFHGVHGCEVGGSFPLLENLDALKIALFNGDAKGAEKLDRLFVKGKYNNAMANRDAGEVGSYAAHLRELPQAYWADVLKKAKDPEGWNALEKEDKPIWYDTVLEPRTRGGYFKAIRYYLGEELTVSAQRAGLTETMIESLQSNKGGHEHSSTFKLLKNCLYNIGRRDSEFKELYSVEHFNSLPVERPQCDVKAQDASWVERTGVPSESRQAVVAAK